MRDRQAQMALARQRLLTMAFGDMETIRMVSPSTLLDVRDDPDYIVLSFQVASQ
jgi:hypothetical protein